MWGGCGGSGWGRIDSCRLVLGGEADGEFIEEQHGRARFGGRWLSEAALFAVSNFGNTELYVLMGLQWISSFQWGSEGRGRYGGEAGE